MALEKLQQLRRRAVGASLFDGRVELSPESGESFGLSEEPAVGDKRFGLFGGLDLVFREWPDQVASPGSLS